jgi:hypothetical protein
LSQAPARPPGGGRPRAAGAVVVMLLTSRRTDAGLRALRRHSGGCWRAALSCQGPRCNAAKFLELGGPS